MDDRLDYGADITRRYSDTTSRWQMRAVSALSFESGDDDGAFSLSNQHLQYIPEKQIQTHRRLIPATWPELLAYYRSYVTSIYKTQLVSMQYVQFNRFLWYYLFNLFFKSLPHTYIQVFLATYSKKEHFFVDKMVPLAYGLLFIYVITAFIQIFMLMDSAILLLDYTVCGLLYKNPWNECRGNSTFYYEGFQDYLHCHTMNTFTDIIKKENTTYYSEVYSFKKDNSSYYFFHIAQVTYHMQREYNLNKITSYGSIAFWYFIILWIIMNLLHNQLFKTYIWKVHYITQWMVNVMYLCIFLHLMIDYFYGQLENRADVPEPYFYMTNIFWSTDLNMLAESMTTPPLIHILLSRNKRETQLSGDSSAIIISNGIYYIFKGLLAYRMKKYCESVAQVPIHLLYGSSNSFFYFWPIYFSTFYMGGIFTIIFFLLHFVMDFCTLEVTYLCLIEAIVDKWRRAKKIAVTVISLICGVIIFIFTDNIFRLTEYVVTQGAATFLEIIVIYNIYPISRLVDDISFFTGVIPTRMRILNLRLVPIYYAVKIYIMYDRLFDIILKSAQDVNPILSGIMWNLVFLAAFIVIGIIYAIVKYICFQKKKWISLIVPDASWGPEYSVRQMRKEYNSQDYVGSQAPRRLSRYMIHKAEAKKYTLNIKYKKSSKGLETPPQFSHKDEKKNL